MAPAAVILDLTPEQRAAAGGGRGEGVARAMTLVTALARATGATRLVPITRAHVDAARTVKRDVTAPETTRAPTATARDRIVLVRRVRC